jgi:tRNA dimethylallyltransferase
MRQNKFLISVIGPTAIGKTSLSIALAQYYKTEIISADSRQFYKEMRVGTAVPSEEELRAVKHHFIQHKSIQENYSVGMFEQEACAALETLFKKYSVVVLVGGSGLFHKAVMEGLDKFPEIDPAIRDRLNKRLKVNGIEDLQKELKQLDPESFSTIDIHNPQRVIRALEVCIGTKATYSSFKTNSGKKRDFIPINIGLTANRNIIYDRINKRVELMIENGLFEEAWALYQYKSLNAMNTVGYKELFSYMDQEYSFNEAIEKIKTNTRRFAKRQLTWFKKDQTIKWFDYDTAVEEIFSFTDSVITKQKKPN